MIPRPEDQPTLRVAEVADLLDIGESTAYDAIARGQIPHIKVGRRILVPTAALRRLLDLDANDGAPSQSAAADTDQEMQLHDRSPE